MCKSKGVDQLKAGDLLSIRLPGSGGYGPPTERDPEIVRWDVLNGKVSPEAASEHYGVVLNEDLTVNIEKTDRLRHPSSAEGNL
jgi:N-methylhydantoinase B